MVRLLHRGSWKPLSSQFQVSIDNFAAKVRGKVAGGAQGALSQILLDVIKRTPVDTGEARGNWYVSPELLYTHSEFKLDKDGLATWQNGIAALAAIDFTKDFKVYIANHTVYIVRLEYGWSKQAPAGMVRITAAEWSQTVREVFSHAGGDLANLVGILGPLSGGGAASEPGFNFEATS